MYILDTNVCIYFMKNTYPDLTEKIFAVNPADMALSSITVFELAYGAEKSNWGERTKQKLAMFLAPFNILPFTVDDAIVAGKLRGYLANKGLSIGPYDIQIAAQGISRDAVVVTHNIKEFSRVPNLTAEDWLA